MMKVGDYVRYNKEHRAFAKRNRYVYRIVGIENSYIVSLLNTSSGLVFMDTLPRLEKLDDFEVICLKLTGEL